MERNEKERTAFLEEVSEIPSDRIIWMDEAGIDEILYREYAYESKGKRAYSDVTGKRVARTTLIAGYRGGKIIAPWYFKGTTDRDSKSRVAKWWKHGVKTH